MRLPKGHKSSSEIRRMFLDYFVKNHDHKFIKSSSVIPFCDPTLAFVNAGMNQFKSIFLGKASPPAKRVVNSQKCIRVGGKHNDLKQVGHDGYHHTFFEMLGNWSFNNYFKEEACEMALNLLKGPYNIDASRLYVTYFGGDVHLALEPDLECFEIWRRLGIRSDRIIPFGSKENFWEMGEIGPCGPSTEIHIDHKPNFGENRANLVNNNHQDMIELWNIVFIQYNRNEDGSIERLPIRHVDTGMGLERLTAVLQNKRSNYDTDLFLPIFENIQKVSKVSGYTGQFPLSQERVCLDTSYRKLADHSRMVVVCLSDGMLPDQNQKLRRVLRESFKLSMAVFGVKNLIAQIVPTVILTFDSMYPEMTARKENVIEIINYELEIYEELKERSLKAIKGFPSIFSGMEDIDLIEYPGFVSAYKEFCLKKSTFLNRVIPGEFLYKLYDTYGLSEECFQKLAESEGMSLDKYGLSIEIAKATQKSKQRFQSNIVKKEEEALLKLTQKLPPTDSQFKYIYEFDEETKSYKIPTVTARIVGMVQGSKEVLSTSRTYDILQIITNRSNFFYASGGQQSDHGYIRKFKTDFHVQNVSVINDCVVHEGTFDKALNNEVFNVGDEVELIVEPQRRKYNTFHHSATHILNEVIRLLFNKPTYQVSSTINEKNFKFEISLIGKHLKKTDVVMIESFVKSVIKSAIPVQITTLNMSDAMNQSDIKILPGEIYPESGLRLVTIENDSMGFISKELCCGTHVKNTKEIENFCITNFKQTNRARYAFTGISGDIAKEAFIAGEKAWNSVSRLEDQSEQTNSNAIKQELERIRTAIYNSTLVLPFQYKINILEKSDNVLKSIKINFRQKLLTKLVQEMKQVLVDNSEEKHNFIIHHFTTPIFDQAHLDIITKLGAKRPILVVISSEFTFGAQCCVPKDFITSEFTAQSWLKEFSSVFKNGDVCSKKQNANEKSRMIWKISTASKEDELKSALLKARNFAIGTRKAC